MPDWNPEFLTARIAREAHFLIELPPSPASFFCLCAKAIFSLPFLFFFLCALPLTDQRLSQGNHQLLKASHGGDSGPRYGLLCRFIACVLGFDALRSGYVSCLLCSATQIAWIFCPDCSVALRLCCFPGKKKEVSSFD